MASLSHNQLEAMLQLSAELAQRSPDTLPFRITRVVMDLAKVARALHRRYEAACSYSYANTEAYERRTERLEADAVSIAANIPGLTVEHQRDPRGWPLILTFNGANLGRLG